MYRVIEATADALRLSRQAARHGRFNGFDTPYGEIDVDAPGKGTLRFVQTEGDA